MPMKLHEMKARRKALKQEYSGIVAREADMPEGESLPAEDVTRLDAIEGELRTLDSRIARCETALQMDADTTAEPNTEGSGNELGYVPGSNTGSVPASAAAFFPDQKGWKAARFVLGVMSGRKSTPQNAAEFVHSRFGDKQVADEVFKALNTTGTTAGGALIPQAFLPELIELLRARVVIRRLNPTIVPMPLGNMTIPRLAAGATAGYQGELDDIGISQEQFDDVQLNAKKLTALVPVSNDLIRRAPIGVEAIVRDDLVETVARREDIAFLRGDGSGNSPVGLLNQASASNKLLVAPFAAQDNATVLGTVVGVLNTLRFILKQNMSRMIRPAWIFSPQIEWFLMGLRDGVGNFVYKDELETGKLLGLPYEVSQQLPTNLNTAATGGPTLNGSEIYLVDMADVVLGDTFSMTIDASDVATYKDQAGNIVSAYQRDQSVFRVIEEHDLALRHQASVIIATVPAWAPAGYTNFGVGQSYFVQPLNADSSAAPSTWGTGAPTGSNNPGNSSANAPGGTQPGRA